MSDQKSTDDQPKQSGDDKGEAWKINSEPKDGPDWEGEGLSGRDGDETDDGEAWEINENTAGSDK